jgi:ABC-type nitrate/sulfonate/bicarbonate transport system permease component
MMDARMMGYVEIILVAMLSIAVLGRLSDVLLSAVLVRALHGRNP